MAIFTAFVIALVISLLFAPGYRRNGSLVPLVIFFFILFMAGVASQFWISPFGPLVAGVYWLPNLLFVIFLAFLFLAPSYYPERRVKAGSGSDVATAPAVVVSAFIWLALIALVIAIFIGYYRNPDRFSSAPQQSNPSVQQTSTE